MGPTIRTGGNVVVTEPIRRKILHGLVAAMAVWLTGASAWAARVELGASADTAELTVGCMFPMTGRAASYGQDSVAGIRVALADLEREAAAGLAGTPPALHR